VETPHPVPRPDVAKVLRGVLESQNIELVSDSATGTYVLRSREPRPPVTQAGGTRPQEVELFVIALKHARAADVAATVNALYGRGTALGEIGDRAKTLSEELRNRQITVPPTQAAQTAPSTVSQNASFSGDVTIVPDARANTLLIRSSPSDFALILAAVKAIDVRPLQVLIEVLVAEIRSDRSFSFGVDATLPPTHVNSSDNPTISGSMARLGVADFVLKVMGIGGVDAEATLRAAASRGDATIVSRPVLLAANNEPAEINVGSQRPFVQVARVLPTDNAARDQVVEYKDVGTRLRVIPTISSDGYVMLQVTQEVNAATSEQQFEAPVISTRSVDTKLLIRDGQTIVLGGLTDREHETSQGGVPLLSSIPLLGGLFGHVEHQTTRTELFLFLTPHILVDDEDVNTISKPYEQRARKAKP
jgi:general secretion pathway protein D